MPLVTVDTKNERNFEERKVVPIQPRGIYRFSLKSIDLKTTKGSQKPMLSVVLSCEEEAFKAVEVYDNIVLDGKSDWKLIHLALATHSHTKESLQALGGAFNTDDIKIGSELWADVGFELKDPADAKSRDQNRIYAYKWETATQA